MELICTDNYYEFSRKVANLLSAQVLMKPNCVLGLATGATPVGAYEQLVQWHKKGDLSFAYTTTVNLDEYIGLSADAEQSYSMFMHMHFFDRVDIDCKRTHIPNGMARSLEAECKRYDRIVKKLGRIDMQLLGMGHNGHIGFNEPGDQFFMDTHVVTLSEQTRTANSRFFNGKLENVPTQAISLGIRSIMQARKVVLAVNGEEKMDTLRQVLNGPVTPHVPASILQLHQDITVVCCPAIKL